MEPQTIDRLSDLQTTDTAPVVIAGAPRSGASIVAQAMAANGVFLGDQFGRVTKNESLDHLSDKEVVALHTQYLEAQGASWKNAAALKDFAIDEARFAAAASAVLAKFNGRSLWGWKDPRTLFFLEVWQRLLPDLHAVLVVRRPTEIAWATVARHFYTESSRWKAAQDALNLWAVYNQRLLAHAARYPEQTTVLLLPDDLERGAAVLGERMPARWDTVWSSIDLQAHFNPYVMRADVPRWIRMLARRHRDVNDLWEALQRHRAFPNARRASMVRKRPPPQTGLQRVVVASRTRMAYTETFIRAHIQGLPAHVDWLLVEKTGEVFTNDQVPLNTLWQRAQIGVRYMFGTQAQEPSIRAMQRYLKKQRIEAVLAEFGPVAVKVMEACHREGIPLIAHFHGYDASQHYALNVFREAYHRLFEVASALVVVSHDMVTQLENLGAPREKIHYNPCSVDVNAFYGANPAEAPPTFLATGRFVHKKAPHFTLLAFAQVVAECPEARLIIVGDGILKPVCLDLARSLGMEDAVEFIGFLPHTAIASLMRSVRGFVQHSITAHDGNTEGTPVAVMEAAASGLPIVSTFHAGIKEVVQHGTTGFLVEEGAVDAMAGHLLTLARHPEVAQRMGAAGRAFIQDSPFERTGALNKLWHIINTAITGADNTAGQ